MDLLTELKKIPPVTRFLTASLVSVTLPVLMKIVSPYRVVFINKLIFPGFELWRLHTAFFLGGSGLTLLFDLVMLYRTTNEIEIKSYKNRSADLAWQLFWACGGIIIATFPLGAMIFFHPLLLCLVYLYAALAPAGTMTSIFGLITIPIKYYPYALIGMDLIMGGPNAAALAVAGAAVGHVWWWGVWGGNLAARGPFATYSRAPVWLRRWFGEDRGQPPAMGGAAAGLAQAGIHVSAPRRPLGATGGAPPTTELRHSWGSGQRLG